jgi:superfamily II DNA or RNA helicase
MICCDEAHHMCAETYRPLIEKLHATRKLGFTATPYRSDCYTAAQDEEGHIQRAFSWFGEVLVHIPWREVEAAGLIARIGRARIDVNLTPEFRAAYAMSAASQKQYLAALNPAKLNALVALCAMHGPFNHGGIVFVTHLVVATVVQRCLTRCLGEGWAVLSGGSAHGEDETHSAVQNAGLVKQFNDGQLRGLVCTNVAAGAMDIPDCCFAVDLDTDGGRANMAQRLGRVARTQRVHAKPNEHPGAILARRLGKQKEAWYYDLVTRDTEDESTARRRHAFFASEGYGEEIPMSADSLVGRVAGEGVALPYVALGSQMVLLKEVLQYNALKGVCAGANAAASKAKLPFSAEVQRLQLARDKTPSAVMKDKYASAIRRAKVEQRQAAERARRERFTRTVHFRALLYTFAPLEPRRRNCVKMMHAMGRSTVQPRDWCVTLSQCKPSPM